MTLKNPKRFYGALVIGALLLTTYLISDYRQYIQDREDQSIQLGEQAGIRVASELDAQLSEISARAATYAAEVAAIDNEKMLLRSIRKESWRFPLVMGVTVAYAPGQFLERDR